MPQMAADLLTRLQADLKRPRPLSLAELLASEESLVAARQFLDGDEYIVHRLIPRAEALSILEKAESLARKQDLGSE